MLLGAVALSLPAHGRGTPSPRRAALVGVLQAGALLAATGVFVWALRVSSATGVVLALDLAVLVLASMAVSRLRPAAVLQPSVNVRPSATRSLGLDEVLFSDAAATADGTSAARYRAASPRP
jgi:hypothetical protein